MIFTLTTNTLYIGILMVNLIMIAFFLVVLREGRNRVANRLLSLFCVLQALGYAGDLLAANHVYDRYPTLIGFDWLILFTLGPCCYLYALAMTQLHFRFRPAYFWHLLPVLVALCCLLPFKVQAPARQLAQFTAWNSNRQPTPFWIFYLPKVFLLGYLLATYQLIDRHQKTIREILSDVAQKDLRWLKRWLFILLGLSASWVLINVNLIVDPLFGLIHLAYSYWLGYYVINQKAIYARLTTALSLDTLDEPATNRYRNSTLTEAEKADWMAQISDWMDSQKPYLNKELTLTALAEQLHLPPTKLSQLLNEGFSENFYTFINRYRIEESKRLLLDSRFAHYTILGVAFEAGFNTKSTFNKTFREVVGQSPSDYQKQHRKLADPQKNSSG